MQVYTHVIFHILHKDAPKFQPLVLAEREKRPKISSVPRYTLLTCSDNYSFLYIIWIIDQKINLLNLILLYIKNNILIINIISVTFNKSVVILFYWLVFFKLSIIKIIKFIEYNYTKQSSFKIRNKSFLKSIFGFCFQPSASLILPASNTVLKKYICR